MKLHNHLLRNLRFELGFSQELMSLLMETKQTTYHRLETGKTKLKMEHIPKIAKASQQTEEDILSKLRGCTITTSNHDNATENQNLVLHLKEDNAPFQQILEEKERFIQSQTSIIELQQFEINRLKDELAKR